MKTILLDSFWTICSAITSSVAALATVYYVYLTYKILKETSNTSSLQVKLADAQIYNSITKILSSAEANKLLDLLENAEIQIEMSRNTQSQDSSTSIMASELQRLILDPIEDLAKYRRDALISLESIDTGFGYKILAVGSNLKIVNYIKTIRVIFKSNSAYEGLESLYNEIRELVTESERTQYPDYFHQN